MLRSTGGACELSSGGSEAEAIKRLEAAAPQDPVLARPVEFGLLLHHPGSGTAIGSDHFVVVTAVEHDMVRFHDPHGLPHATLAASDFATAWSAETIGRHPALYTMRAGFRAVSHANLPRRYADRSALARRQRPVASRMLAGAAASPPPRRPHRSLIQARGVY